jgi:hypothetical protein
MDAKYLEVDEFQTIAKSPLGSDSGGIEIGGGLFKKAYQQQSIHGKPVQTLDECYAAAKITEPIYKSLVSRLISVCPIETERLGGRKSIR